MTGSRSARLLAWTGPLFAVLFLVAVLGVQGDTPGEGASGQEVVAYYDGNETETLVSVFSAGPLAALLVLFFAHLRWLARERRVATGAGPTVMVAGSVLWAAGLLFGATLELALGIAADEDQEGVAETLNVLGNASWIPFITGIAVTLVGAALTVLTSDFLPRWLGWVAAVAGVVSLLGPGGFLGFFVGPLWMLVAGVLLARPDRTPLRDVHRVERRTDARALQDV